MSDDRQQFDRTERPAADARLRSVLLKLIPLTLLLLGIPFLVVWLDGQPVMRYLRLPPELPPAVSPPFSWSRFTATLLLIVLALSPFLVRIWRCRREVASCPVIRRSLPGWAYLGLTLMIASWVIAWNRFEWAIAVQAYTFTPIWLGYIVLINALTVQRAGASLMTRQPRLFLLLFPVSSLFWWFFEYLNRFARNWQYSGTGETAPWSYILEASLPFSTVLPAVLSTRDYLATFPRLYAGLGHAWRPAIPRRLLATALLAFAMLGLLGLPLWPLQLYPLVWIAPLFIVIGLQTLLGERTLLDPSLHGDWRPLWLAALAALACGFFWELWNWHSVARWEYNVPYVGRFKLFEMPILGYAGYLPFGLECLAAVTLFFGARRELLYGESLPRLDEDAAGARIPG